jgi:hypothetical protein
MKRTFYAVVPKDYEANKMFVLLLARSKATARRIYEKWNDDSFRCDAKWMKDTGLKFVKVKL